MFASTGLFKGVPCPRADQCQLLNCIFSHDDVNLPGSEEAVEPVYKKRRLEDEGKPPTPSRAQSKTPASSNPDLIHKSNGKLSSLPHREISLPPSRQKEKTESLTLGKPPATLASMEPTAQQSPLIASRTKIKESLNPRELAKPPASHALRLKILKMLHEAMVELNTEVAEDEGNYKKELVLSPEELVAMALDEEEKAAKGNPSVYSNVIKLRIVGFKKMKVDDWEANVLENFHKKYIPEVSNANKGKEIKTGLTKEEEIAMLPYLLTPLKGLEMHGYVTTIPTAAEIQKAQEGVQAAEGYETCERCGSRFQAFPGRREEDGALTSGGSCTHHSAKPMYGNKARPTYYPCCNQSIGESSGCTKGECHVFKVTEVKRLAAVLQFETTPPNPDQKAKSPVCFDCEMGYTTFGLELIRLTATAWPGGEEILDVLVRPIGEVLDLNSKYSGVFPEHFLKAKPYNAGTSQKDTSDGDNYNQEKALQIVESPAAARALLFSFLQPETPLIGHAIDNDLNVCRIIHPTIIDTVLLYPHPKGLPIRFGLKALARKYLERNIQMGGDSGHDSKEDAVATGDLVRVKVVSRWEQMRREGWTVMDGGFHPPLPPEDKPNKKRDMLGAGGARPKRPA